MRPFDKFISKKTPDFLSKRINAKESEKESLKEDKRIQAILDERKTSDILKITRQQEFIFKVDLGFWKAAHQEAINIYRPRRILQTQVFKDAMIDTFLSGKTQTRLSGITNTPFKVVDETTGEKDELLTKELEKSWFNKYLAYDFEAEMYGYSFLEFAFAPKTGKVASILLLPRENCVPECRAILTDIYSETLTDLDLPEYSNNYLMLIAEDNLGLLHKIAPHTIMKRHAKAFWSRFQELFGVPFRYGTYTGRDGRVIDALEQNLKNMGSAAYGVFPEGTNIEFKENSKADAYGVFLEAIKQANEEISQGILGVGASNGDTGSFAKEKVAYTKESDLIKGDLRRAEFHVNDYLFPLLNTWGYDFSGKAFVFDLSSKLPLGTTQIEIDEKIAAMGLVPTQAYIQDTYGTPTEKKPLALPLA